MFIWLNVLLSVLFFPFVFLLGKYTGTKKVSYYIREKYINDFPVSSKTPVFEFESKWLLLYLQKKYGFAANAFLCFIFYRSEFYKWPTTEHEAIHVLQQSVLSPFFVFFVYAFDLIALWPFRHYFEPRAAYRVPLIEHIAYKMDGRIK
tara:strand:- start:651 stop:1094 length:444 start_codon:yes stop_codon:yes gene_type:complete